METIALIAGLLLPWLFGVALSLALRGTTHRLTESGAIAWLVGTGYLVGAFALTLWMRLLSLAGLRFGVIAIALPLLMATALLAWLGWRRQRDSISDGIRGALRALAGPPDLDRATRILWCLILGWLALRFVVLGLEVGQQPLYPWDAWIQWATKSRVWYELGRIAPFVRVDAWLAAGGSSYFDASPEYPPTVSLLQVWTCIALGRWDDTLMNWPWWQFAVALALAMYGGLRSLDVSPLSALVGTFFVASLPLANVHVALAGYADLPLAAFYSAAVLALLRWQKSGDFGDAAITLVLALACTQIKNPGIFWALTLIPGVVVGLWPRHAIKLMSAGFGGAVLVLLALTRFHLVIYRYPLNLDFDPAWVALGESFFLLGNWHLLWYGAIAAAVLASRQLYSARLAPLTATITSGLFFLFVVFGFSSARDWVESQTTVNRATLPFAPLVVVFMVLAFREFSEHWRAAHADKGGEPAPSIVSGTPERA